MESPPRLPDDASAAGAVTLLLDEARRGRAGALDDLFPLVYAELSRLARAVRRGGAGETLNTTALVHEAYLKLAHSGGTSGGDGGVDWQSRQHFFRVAARAMRQVIVRDAERRRAAKRGGGAPDVPLRDSVHGAAVADDDVLALDASLARLAALDARQAAVVELRFFAGLSIAEAADVLGVAVATVNRDWAVARLWLARDLAR